MKSTLELNEESMTFRVNGDLISTTAEGLRNEVNELLKVNNDAPRKWNLFILDLTSAKMVDSVGLNLVVSMLKRVRMRGARMQVTYSSPNIMRTFTFTRLDKQIQMVQA